MSRSDRSALPVALAALAALLAIAAVPAAASPALVSACPPCDEGFVSAAASHELDTDVRHSEATVRVHRNGSAAWTTRVVPTNGSVLDALAGNESLARAVAGDSFGVRYGAGIDHELRSARVVDGAFVVRYRTLDAVRDGPAGTELLTYFRDDPGAYVYAGLGADELTVVAPPGSTVARGFGEVDGQRMTATALPDARNGPFVVFAPTGTPLPGLVGVLAAFDALAGVVARNFLLFVLLPGGTLVGGLALVRRAVDPTTERRPGPLGAVVAAGGALLVAATLRVEGAVLPLVTGNLLVGGSVGAVVAALGLGVALPGLRERLSVGRLVGGGVAAAVAVVAASGAALGGGSFHTTLSLGIAALPVAVAVGRADGLGDTVGTRLLVGLGVGVFGLLAATAPLTALGGTLFPLAPFLLAVAAVGAVVASVPLYLLGAASATAADGRAPVTEPGSPDRAR